MNKLMTATALALALGAAAPALAQTSNDARGGEAMAQSKPTTTGNQAGTSTPATAGEAWYGRFSADELIGKDVVNAKGDNVGEIQDVVVDPSSKAMYAVVSVGGFLGMGDKDVAIPFDQMRMNDRNANLMSETSADQLKQLPAYKKTDAWRPVERNRPILER